MALILKDKWLWDFWFAVDGPDYHLFYLQAPNSLEREELRHWNVSIGHAVSRDLRRWTVLPDALAPSPPPEEPAAAEAADSKTTWTGSVLRHAGLWYLFYTGTRASEDGLRQRVCLATSPDLTAWTRHPANPQCEADPRWYELLASGEWRDEAWRDPWVFHSDQDGLFHMFVTARVKDGPLDGRGVIGHAVSADLRAWQVREPVTAPGRFAEMEVPQLVTIEGRHYLLFATTADRFSRQAPAGAAPTTGFHYLVGDSPLGPFRYLHDDFFVGDATGSYYSGKLIQGPDGRWYAMAFENFDPAGGFVGRLTDPMPVEVAPDGRLRAVFPVLEAV